MHVIKRQVYLLAGHNGKVRNVLKCRNSLKGRVIFIVVGDDREIVAVATGVCRNDKGRFATVGAS